MLNVGVVTQAPDGRVRRIILGTSASPSLGDWAAWAETRAAGAAVAAALAAVGAPPLTAASVDEAISMGTFSQDEGSDEVARRRVHALHEAQLLPALAALPDFERDESSEDVTPTIMLLTHVFATADGALRLTTLVRRDAAKLVGVAGTSEAALRRAVFGDAHVALAQEAVMHGTRAWTDVALGGSSLSCDAVASLSSAQRVALKAAQSAQLLHAVSACIEARFAGGITMLQAATKRSQPQVAAALDALSLKLITTRGERSEARPMDNNALATRVHHGEALEKEGDFVGAAAVYKRCIDDMARDARGYMMPPLSKGYRVSLPLLWSFFGLALKRSGRLAEADDAYEAGLRALLAMPLQAGRAYEVEQEALRLDLLVKLVMLHRSCGNAAACVSAQRRIFQAQLADLEADGDEGYIELRMSGGATLTGTRTRRRWELVMPGEDGGDDLSSYSRIVPRANAPARWRPPRTPELRMPAPGTTLLPSAADNLRLAGSIAGRHNLPSLPKLPAAHCAVCAAPATKRCSACGVPFYCGAASQRQDWKAHKAACKAATAAASGAAAAAV